ncbi:shikimate dehydrogenase [Vagococcus bubulae]|uniref:shikimate dehydrogenase n=1 Tax=Vagococcus bubulae TaxID=1977868 RepID=UPI0022E7F546|nr:shikimate dehydrogenase [Vagococcus bubulae]
MSCIEVNGHTRLAGFFASPAKHSLSPTLHTTSFEELGINAVYLAFDIKPDQLDAAINSIRTLNMMGVNLSMPHKVNALPLMDELSKEATLIGAINTIVHKEGKLIGHNTDGFGFMESLRVNQVPIKNQTMTILGAGGAATAIVVQAALDGFEKIHLFSRPGERFDDMQKKIEELSDKVTCKITITNLFDLPALKQAISQSHLLVNSTSVGMTTDESLITDDAIFRKDLVVYDVIYNPRKTLLLKQAQSKGCQTINGLDMLLYQGAKAFNLWTNEDMPVKKVKEIIDTI